MHQGFLPRRAAVVFACALLGFGGVAHAEDAAIHIDNFAFTPATITVKPGTRVTFTNRDDIPHTVVSAAKTPLFKSPHPLDTDDTFVVTFDKPGTYAYFCSLHAHMQGTIVVK